MDHLRKVWESVSGDGGTGDHTTDSDHCQASILQFSELVFLELLGRLWLQSQGIESVVTGSTIVIVHVGQSGEGACLYKGDPRKDLDHGRIGQGIVCVDDVGNGFETELLTGDAHEFGNNDTNGCQHSGTSVLQFGLTVPRDPFGGALFFGRGGQSKESEQILNGSAETKTKRK